MFSRSQISPIRERIYFSAIREQICFSAIRERNNFSAIRVSVNKIFSDSGTKLYDIYLLIELLIMSCQITMLKYIQTNVEMYFGSITTFKLKLRPCISQTMHAHTAWSLWNGLETNCLHKLPGQDTLNAQSAHPSEKKSRSLQHLWHNCKELSTLWLTSKKHLTCDALKITARNFGRLWHSAEISVWYFRSFWENCSGNVTPLRHFTPISDCSERSKLNMSVKRLIGTFDAFLRQLLVKILIGTFDASGTACTQPDCSVLRWICP